MEDFKNKVLDLVKENLPEATAGEMKKYIEDSEAIKESLTLAEDVIAKSKESIEKLSKENHTLHLEVGCFREKEVEIESKLLTVNKREEDVAQKERDLMNIVLQNQLAATQKTSDDILRLVDKVFGHPNVRIDNQKAIGQGQINGIYEPDLYNTETITKTVTKD